MAGWVTPNTPLCSIKTRVHQTITIMKKRIILFLALAACSIIPMYGYPQEEIDDARTAAIEAIESKVGDNTDADILEVVSAAKEEIGKNSNVTQIAEIRDLAIYKIMTIKDINTKIGDRTHKLFYNVVISDKMNLLKHAQNQNAAKDIRIEIMSRLELAVWVYDSAKAEDQMALPTNPEGTKGHTMTITKNDKSLTLINPDKVIYGKPE